jgi:NAD(P)H-dependent flavin oxidoreductase YrpB (nitropropane dioxygenase family)
MATVEAPVHDSVKQAMVDADERQTQLIYRPLRNTSRIFRNEIAEQVHDIEVQKGRDLKIDDLAHLVAGVRGRQVFESGDLNAGIWSAGMVIGLIHDIPTCSELVARIVREAEALIRKRLEGMLGDGAQAAA